MKAKYAAELQRATEEVAEKENARKQIESELAKLRGTSLFPTFPGLLLKLVCIFA